MKKTVAIAILSSLLTAIAPSVALAETVLERVERIGALRVGARTDAYPLEYIDGNSQWDGYSVDLLRLIRQEVQRKVGRNVEMQFGIATPDNQISLITRGTVDIICGPTSYTWNREQYVDFSISYFITGTRLLVNANSPLGAPETLVGKRIGVIPGTTNSETIGLVQPQVTLVTVADRQSGLAALRQGRIDGLASDGILLEGLRLQQADAQQLKVVPDVPYYLESYACMLPENDSEFRDLVDFTLTKFMYEVTTNNRLYTAILDRWFGPGGVIPLPRELVMEYFDGILSFRSQAPPVTF